MGISVQPIGKVGEIQTICSLSITQVEPGNLQPNLQTVDLCNSRVATVSRAEVMDWVGRQRWASKQVSRQLDERVVRPASKSGQAG